MCVVSQLSAIVATHDMVCRIHLSSCAESRSCTALTWHFVNPTQAAQRKTLARRQFGLYVTWRVCGTQPRPGLYKAFPVCGGMQRVGTTRLLQILTTAANSAPASHCGTCSSWLGVLSAWAPASASCCSSVNRCLRGTAFDHERIAIVYNRAAPTTEITWQPLSDQRRYKSKKKAGQCLKHSLSACTCRMPHNMAHEVQVRRVKRAKGAATLQTRRWMLRSMLAHMKSMFLLTETEACVYCCCWVP